MASAREQTRSPRHSDSDASHPPLLSEKMTDVDGASASHGSGAGSTTDQKPGSVMAATLSPFTAPTTSPSCLRGSDDGLKTSMYVCITQIKAISSLTVDDIHSLFDLVLEDRSQSQCLSCLAAKLAWV